MQATRVGKKGLRPLYTAVGRPADQWSFCNVRKSKFDISGDAASKHAYGKVGYAAKLLFAWIHKFTINVVMWTPPKEGDGYLDATYNGIGVATV